MIEKYPVDKMRQGRGQNACPGPDLHVSPFLGMRLKNAIFEIELFISSDIDLL